MSISLEPKASATAEGELESRLGWKRSLDLLVLALVSPAVVTCCGAIALWIKLVSRGPVFFRQERIGYRGRRFFIFKFRTMHPQADGTRHEEHMATLLQGDRPMGKLDLAGDKRLIPGARALRAAGLDELPQLINVLKGEMSLVGPRPCTVYEHEHYAEWHKERFAALPGLTGLWQVSGKNRTTFKRMIELDIEYARHASLGLDLAIMARTVPALLGQVGDIWRARREGGKGLEGARRICKPDEGAAAAPVREINKPGASGQGVVEAARAAAQPVFGPKENTHHMEKNNMKNPIKVGVVGCGYWGPNLARNFRGLRDCELHLLCDASEARLRHMQNMYPEVKTSPDAAYAMNGSGLDAVAIATPVRFHYGMAKAALLAGKHTFIEKPMASTAAECQELVEIAREKGLVLMVGHTFLYSPVVRRLKQIIDQGDIGDIQYICSRRLNLGLFQKDMNVAWDLAPHDVSILLYIMGELPQTVSCMGTAHVTPGVEDVVVMYLTFTRQRCAIVHNSWLDPRKVREMTIVGTRRMVVYDDVANQEKLKIFDARVETPPHYDTFAEFQYAYHYGDTYAPFIQQDEPLKLECQHFIDCIREGKQPLTNGQHGLELVRILEAAKESLASGGQAIEFNPASTIVPMPRGTPTPPDRGVEALHIAA